MTNQAATFNSAIPKSEDNTNSIKILWTGGLDSTFRMIELSRENVIIQPYYLCDKRKSEWQELTAISLVTEDINHHPDTRCKILPLKKVMVADLKPDEEISKAYQRLFKTTGLGIQFDWLARFANSVPGLELGMEKSGKSKGYRCVKTLGSVKLVKTGNLSYYYLDKDNSSDDLIKVFGNFHFPYHLFNITKLTEHDLFIKKGYENTLKKTWFCHTPVNNKPCGVCHPCKSLIEEQLSYRLPPSALNRYKLHEKYGEDSIYARLFRLRLKIEKQSLQLYKLFITNPR